MRKCHSFVVIGGIQYSVVICVRAKSEKRCICYFIVIKYLPRSLNQTSHVSRMKVLLHCNEELALRMLENTLWLRFSLFSRALKYIYNIRDILYCKEAKLRDILILVTFH